MDVGSWAVSRVEEGSPRVAECTGNIESPLKNGDLRSKPLGPTEGFTPGAQLPRGKRQKMDVWTM